MDPARWTRMREIGEAVGDLPASEREAAPRSACGEDDSLFDDLRGLLDPAGQSRRLFDDMVAGAVSDVMAPSPEGKRVGPYRIVREIGHGGMGAVYLADRVDGQFEQRVALKLIKPGLATEQFLRRFRDERQILAHLQHPHIARLLDGAVDDEGRPYFALEYVEGEPIDRYCDGHALSVEERLTLFLDVCRAVMYAHASLVIHRDLKPAHILVTVSGLPVLARPDTWTYRVGKFASRHRVGLTMASATVVAFAAFVGYHTVRLANERDRAQQQTANRRWRRARAPRPESVPGYAPTALPV